MTTPYTQEVEEALAMADAPYCPTCPIDGRCERCLAEDILAALVRSQAEEIAGLKKDIGRYESAGVHGAFQRAEQAESSLAAMTKERDESNERIRLIEESGARVWVDEIRKNRDRYMWAESSLAAERATVAELRIKLTDGNHYSALLYDRLLTANQAREELRKERDTFEKVSAGHEVRIVGLLGRIEQLEASCKHETERWQYAESQPNWSNWRNEQLRADAAEARIKEEESAINDLIEHLSSPEAPSESAHDEDCPCHGDEVPHTPDCGNCECAPDSAAGGKANG